LVVEALQAAKVLAEEGIECEVIDLRTISPLDWDAVHSSVKKTRRLIVLDSGAQTGSVAGEIIARVAIKQHHVLEAAPIRLAMPDVPEPTSFGLTKGFFVRGINIYQSAMAMFGKLETVKADVLDEPSPHDVPGEWFKGPF
jgi:pyruvate dehydrogenase E1 component beta subunit